MQAKRNKLPINTLLVVVNLLLFISITSNIPQNALLYGLPTVVTVILLKTGVFSVAFFICKRLFNRLRKLKLNKKDFVVSAALLVMTPLLMLSMVHPVIVARGRVVGCSMYPTIAEGSTIWMKYQQDVNLTGQIVVFVHNGANIVHRVIADNSTHVLTQGDNRKSNPDPDGWSSKELVTSEVIRAGSATELYADIVLYACVVAAYIWSLRSKHGAAT